MKITKIIFSIVGVISVLAIFLGFGLMIQNIGKDNFWFLIFLGIFLAGCVGLGTIALIIMFRKRKK